MVSMHGFTGTIIEAPPKDTEEVESQVRNLEVVCLYFQLPVDYSVNAMSRGYNSWN